MTNLPNNVKASSTLIAGGLLIAVFSFVLGVSFHDISHTPLRNRSLPINSYSGQSGKSPIVALKEIYAKARANYAARSCPAHGTFSQIIRPSSAPIKLTGEVVDTWCYASQSMNPSNGEGHRTCGVACAYGGVTLGILDDTTQLVYIAAKSDKAFQGCMNMLAPYVGKRVEIHGALATRGGCRILKIMSVKPLA